MVICLVKIKLLKQKAKIPQKAHKSDACYDLFSCEDVVLYPNKPTLVSTGIAVAPPDGFYFSVKPRSGLSSKGIIILNSPGTIDNGYRGEIKVIMMNTTNVPYQIAWGDKIAQLCLERMYTAEFVISDELDVTDRGDNGFGSTGK